MVITFSMNLFITEYCRLDRVENGMAIGTFSVPVELCDEIMHMATSVLNGARILKMKSRMLVAQDVSCNVHLLGVKNK